MKIATFKRRLRELTKEADAHPEWEFFGYIDDSAHVLLTASVSKRETYTELQDAIGQMIDNHDEDSRA